MSGSVGASYPENRGSMTVPFSATPTFDGSMNRTFVMTLTGNVTSSTFTNGVDGLHYIFLIRQDSSGLHSFAWPSNVKGAVSIPITSLANTAAAQSFSYDGASGNLYAISTGLINL